MTEAHPGLERFVARLTRRSPLTREETQVLLKLPYRVVQIPPRTDVVSPGESVNHACLVAKGLIGRYDQLLDGRRQITAFYFPGDMADLQSLIAPVPTWGLTALQATTLLYVPHADLGRVAQEYPQIALAFWRDNAVDASLVAKWLVNLGRQDARSRFAHLMCETGIRMEVAGLGTRTSFDLPATQEQLADALGLTAVHVNRTLQSLRADKILEARSYRIEILDWPRLVQLAEFDPRYLHLDEPVTRQFGKEQCTVSMVELER